MPAQDPAEASRWTVDHMKAAQTREDNDSMTQDFISDRTGEPVEALHLQYVVRPAEEWKKLKKFRSCKVENQIYQKEQYAFVRHSHSKSMSSVRGNEEGAQVWDCWVAKILEFRASSVETCWARVFWMYWPEDLPRTKGAASTKGRRIYHGKHELIASNHMEIINVHTLAGIATVDCWQEEDDEDDETQNGLYWRQTLDFRTGQLSALRNHCVCHSPYNPDKTLIQCPNEACMLWLHSECLTDSMLMQRYHLTTSTSKLRKRPQPKKARRVAGTKKPPYEGILEAKTVDVEASTQQWLSITDLRLYPGHEERIWIGPVTCPWCEVSI